MTTEIAIALLTVLGTAISAFVGGDSVGKDDKLPAEKTGGQSGQAQSSH